MTERASRLRSFHRRFTDYLIVGVVGLTRRERLKSALYLRLKKRKRLFKKKLEIFDFFSFRKCIVPKNVKGDPLGFINIYSVAKYQKT